jgi:hypothetical protein
MVKKRFLTLALLTGLCLGVSLGCGGGDKTPTVDNKGVNLKERPQPAAPGGEAPKKRSTSGAPSTG